MASTSSARTAAMATTAMAQWGLTYARMVALAARGGGVSHGEAMCEMNRTVVLRWLLARPAMTRRR